MSALDPLAALTARVAAVEAAMTEAAINLGVSAEVLQAQVSVGDILAARILPPSNGQDLLEILGTQVTAQLPPGVHPGETLLLQVTGFSASQLYVRNLGTPDPQNPLPVNQAVLAVPQPPAQSPPQPATAPVQTLRQNAAAPAPSASPAPASAPAAPALSPPSAVFVAASVRPAPAVMQDAQIPPQQPAPAPAAEPVPRVEARIAAAQAAKLPPIVPARMQAAQSAVASAVSSAVQSAAGVAARALGGAAELLRAAGLPDTPVTRLAAALAPHAPERLPAVLERLQSTLPGSAQDPRISTLRTLAAFVARLDPANEQTLHAQISAYVSNVIEGAEPKLARLLQAHAQADARVPTRPAQPNASAASAAESPQQQTATGAALTGTAAQARAAERAAAISHDLKSVVLSLLRDPPAQRTPEMTQALGETLATLTGVQVNALASNQQTPGTFNLVLPVFFHEGGKPAHIRISREGGSRAAKLDAENFHVAFVLDTAHLGTVAIDLQTTGRAVSVDVKTENAPAAARFSNTLPSLRSRLEALRYRVASAAANALPFSRVSAAREPAATPQKTGVVDLRA